jgi:hypothetical protein
MTESDEIDWKKHEHEVNAERAEWRKGEGAALRDRLIFLLDDLAPSRGKYAYLESRTGISAASWQNLYLEKQMPTLDMILAMSEYRHPYLSWLITGQDPNAGAGQQVFTAPSHEEWETYQNHRAWLRASKKKS